MKTVADLKRELEAMRANLESELQDVESRLEVIDSFCEHFGDDIEVAVSSPLPAPREVKVKPPKEPGEKRVPLGDVAERLLKKADNHEMHVLDILKGVQRFGLNPSRQTMTSALRKDHKDRFEGTGEGKYKLKEQ